MINDQFLNEFQHIYLLAYYIFLKREVVTNFQLIVIIYNSAYQKHYVSLCHLGNNEGNGLLLYIIIES